MGDVQIDRPALADVVRLRPIRTLVVSRDEDYRERALAVLSPLGPVVFALAAPERCDDIEHLLRETRSDVAVLDATDCEDDAGELVAALAKTVPRIGVVVVCHHCTAAARRLRALPKWGWTQDLRAGVERAYRDGNPLRPGIGSLHGRSAWERMAGPLRR